MKNVTPIQSTNHPLVLEDYNRVNVPTAGSGIKRFVALGCLVIVLFVGGSGYWAASSKLDGAVVAPASLSLIHI